MIYLTSNYDDYDFKSKRLWRTDGLYEPFVYIIQEIETEKLYIGSKTAKNCLESDLGTKYFTSSRLVDWVDDEFEICRIYSCASNHDAIILEERLIEQNNAVWDDNYYNRYCPSIGFNQTGVVFTDKMRKKRSEASKGKKRSDETKKKMSDSFKGRIITKEHRIKISNSVKELWGTDSYRIKTVNSQRGHTLSDETKKKMSKSKTGELNSFFGRKHCDETKKKNSDSKKGKKLSDDHKKKLRESKKKLKKRECPYCRKSFYPGNYGMHHGDKCKMKGDR